MAQIGFLRTMLTKIKIDWLEWKRNYVTQWATRRELKQIDQAIKRAKYWHSMDRKTYYIMRDKRGAVNALTSSELELWAKRGLFPRMDYLRRLENSIDIITSDERIVKSFNNIKSAREKEYHEQNN